MEKALGTMKVADLAGNLLRANDKADYTITSDNNAYVLGTMNEQTAFYRAKVGTTLGRYKAYLQWNATLPALSLDFHTAPLSETDVSIFYSTHYIICKYIIVRGKMK